MENYRVIGKPLARKDGANIVSGNIVYGVDVTLPGLRHVRAPGRPIGGGRIAPLENINARFTEQGDEVPR